MSRLPRIALCGPSRCGKDECAKWLAANTPLRYSRSMSQVIAPHVAKRLGKTVDEVFATRHADKQLWFDIGNELRERDPLHIVRECLKDGELVVGPRDCGEIVHARETDLIDLAVWIERDVPEDPTLTYGAELCDVVVLNLGPLHRMFESLRALARFAGLIG